MKRARARWIGAVCALPLFVACDGGEPNPLPRPPPPNARAPSQVTEQVVHITSAGLDQHALFAELGDRITFTNADSRLHQVASDPHPLHTECPEFNGPVLQPGESFTVTVRSGDRRCPLHDHLYPNNPDLRATVQVGGASAEDRATAR